LLPRTTDPPPSIEPPGRVEPIIVVDRLTKRYKRADTNAVDGISFAVQPDELFALLGPNGAGKTTTISILTTMLSPTSGNLRIAGHDVQHEASAVRRDVGIIFQKPSLDLNLTAEENVRLHAILYGMYGFRPTFSSMPKTYQQQLRRLAEVMNIEADLFRPIRTFSGGMRRKLEIMRSLIHRPRVLFLDEPTVGLDPTSRRSLWQYLGEVRAERPTTIFLTTHYLEEAEQADTICIINHGQIVAHGSPADLKAELLGDFLVLDAEDRDTLRLELTALGVSVDEPPPFRIRLDHWSAHELVQRIQTPLAVIRTDSPTLEDAYLTIVGQP
jgi:ABC-2 type transport system ATP-binding protein